jgi:hypothetical protein
MSRRICVFGDNIALGGRDLEFGGWVNHLKVWFANLGLFR